MSQKVQQLIDSAGGAAPDLQAHARHAATALSPLELPPEWSAAAAAVPLLAAGLLGEKRARDILGEYFELARQAARIPDPRLTAPEAMTTGDPAQAENLRRLFMSLIRDIRIVPLVLSQQLARAEALKHGNSADKRQLAHDIFNLYAPLANRLGIWQLKWPLEDAAFHLAYPERYKEIARGLAERRSERETRLEQARTELGRILAQAGIEAQISGRPKHIYSIWRKMQRKDTDLGELYDLMALRIIVADVATCYAALGAVHGRWRHVVEEFDDYIAAPKGNFYRSLHTAILDDEGRALEVQIRTSGMHREAELGVAAHWRYKEGGQADTQLDERIAWLRQILAGTREDDSGAEDFVGHVTSELATERVYALTPRGRVVDLPLGATALDFAYAVHTGLGHRTTGARVNGKMVPLTHQLQTGDTVQALTHAQAKPSRDWLRPENGYLATRRARQKVRAWFRSHEPVSLVSPAEPTAKPVMPTHRPVPRKRPARAAPATRPVVSGMPELAVERARCCVPEPGTPIAAFITRGHGIRVHDRRCPSFQRNAERAPGQVLDARWGSGETTLSVIARTRAGLVEDIVARLTAQGLG
ncbi:MAG TPA: TGS domain-containing protein, partial [Gammaproteobacteria bacterium]|nr:TGS domain-containing protein [Gammaproteobacteria bacterium]